MNIDEQIKYIKEKHGEQHRGMFTKDRALMRSKTFPGSHGLWLNSGQRSNKMIVTMTIKEYKELCYLLEEIEGDLWNQLDFARVEGDEQKIKELEDELDLIQRLTGRKGAKY